MSFNHLLVDQPEPEVLTKLVDTLTAPPPVLRWPIPADAVAVIRRVDR